MGYDEPGPSRRDKNPFPPTCRGKVILFGSLYMFVSAPDKTRRVQWTVLLYERLQEMVPLDVPMGFVMSATKTATARKARAIVTVAPRANAPAFDPAHVHVIVYESAKTGGLADETIMRALKSAGSAHYEQFARDYIEGALVAWLEASAHSQILTAIDPDTHNFRADAARIIDKKGYVKLSNTNGDDRRTYDEHLRWNAARQRFYQLATRCGVRSPKANGNQNAKSAGGRGAVAGAPSDGTTGDFAAVTYKSLDELRNAMALVGQRALQIYNANVKLFDTDDVLVRECRDRLLDFGKAARGLKPQE